MADTRKRMKIPFLILFVIIFSLIYGASQFLFSSEPVDLIDSIDDQLDSLKGDIETLYFDRPEFLAAFRASEISWERYREDYLEMLFPENEKPIVYGSVFPLVYATHYKQITAKHIEDLKIWIIGKEEGELGYGSVLLKHEIENRRSQQAAGGEAAR